MNSSPQTAIIIGAGAIGLSIGWELAKRGLDATIYDRGSLGREASWAAAGMLAAAAETAPGHETFFALARASRERWAEYASKLEAASDRNIGYSSGETFVIAQSQEEEDHLREMVKYLRQFDEPVRLIKKARLAEFEPEANENARLGLLSPRDGQVDNRAFAAALCTAFAKAGGELIQNTEVDDVIVVGGRAVGVLIGEETVSADHVILCAGSWSSNSFPSLEGRVPTVHPVKGQMIAFQSEPQRLKHIVWSQSKEDSVYIVPRADGRIIIGATSEEAGFDQSVDTATLEAQKAKAAKVLPFLGDLEIIDSWAGLRPASADGLPIIGPSEIAGLSLATGHYRNGILLAPITADFIADFVQSDEVPATLIPFSPSRF